MYYAVVAVTLRRSILDPQGSVITKSLASLNFEVTETRVGKYLELTFAATDMEQATKLVDEMCSKLLINKITEEYRLISLVCMENRE